MIMLKEIETNYQAFINESKNDIDVSYTNVDIDDNVNINPRKNKKKGRPSAAGKTTKNGRPTDPDYSKKSRTFEFVNAMLY